MVHHEDMILRSNVSRVSFKKTQIHLRKFRKFFQACLLEEAVLIPILLIVLIPKGLLTSCQMSREF